MVIGMTKNWNEHFVVSVCKAKEVYEYNGIRSESSPYVEVIIYVTNNLKKCTLTQDYTEDEYKLLEPILEKFDLEENYTCIYKCYQLEFYEEIIKTFKESPMFIICQTPLYYFQFNLNRFHKFCLGTKPDYSKGKTKGTAFQLNDGTFMKGGKFYLRIYSFLDVIIKKKGYTICEKEQISSLYEIKDKEDMVVADNIPVLDIEGNLCIEYEYFVKNILPNILDPKYPKLLNPRDWDSVIEEDFRM